MIQMEEGVNGLLLELEIKPTKLVKGQGLAQLMTHANFDVLRINFL